MKAPRNEREAARVFPIHRGAAMNAGWRVGRSFYTPGKGYRVNGWRRILRAIVRVFA